MDLSTTYMGLQLKNPLVVGASPLSDYVDLCKRLEDQGAAALVMHSLFMEQLFREQLEQHYQMDALAESHAESLSYFPEPTDYALGPDEYLEQVARLKGALGIPVIASLNGTASGRWVRHAKLIEEAGADGLELNLYYTPLHGAEAPDAVEQRFLDVLHAVKDQVKIPVSMKLGAFFSSPVNTAQRLVTAGADGLVLFNRIFHPDIDVDLLDITPAPHYSSPELLHQSLLWLAAMFGHVDTSLCASGGVYSSTDAIKAIMAGAHCVQMTSALLKNGTAHMGKVLTELTGWMEENEYESLLQMHGSMSLLRCPDPDAYERSNYLRTLQSWYPPPGFE